VAFDTPINDDDEADVDWLRAQLEIIRPWLQSDSLVLILSQVPVGFSRSIEEQWRRSDPSLQFAYSPENVRLGNAIETFSRPDRTVVGLGNGTEPARVERILGLLSSSIVWMSLESAEMTKHAINSFLAMSAVFANELGRICERVGADMREVERGLRSESRIGPRAYVAAGPPVAGGTLIRDVTFLSHLADRRQVTAPLIHAIRQSNELHAGWARELVMEAIRDVQSPCVAVLGLTYKPGTDTLRRSSALSLANRLMQDGIQVQVFDPAVRDSSELPMLALATSAAEALDGADAAVIATPWGEFRDLSAEEFATRMRQPVIIDQAGFLPELELDRRLFYRRVGGPRAWPRP
jgi:UDPglucose 6-dehydrogenase